MLGLPGNLDGVAKYLKLEAQKMNFLKLYLLGGNPTLI
jgi:hypothetical protein